jgi:protein gp37
VGIKTGIEWTDATWNPIRGCSRVSEGCRNCYAETVANRFCAPGSAYEGVVRIDATGKGLGLWNGQIKFVERRLLDPMHWKRPRKIFVNSMSDLFHENVTLEMLDRIFAVMALCRQHTFQILTKRPERMLNYLSDPEVWGRIVLAMEAIAKQLHWADKPVRPELAHALVTGMPLPHVWLGVSVENQKAADERVPLLLQSPAAVRFISAEPLLGDVRLDDITLQQELGAWCFSALDDEGVEDPDFDGSRVDWVIVGGESGPGARPMHPDWARSLRDQCVAAGVPFFFKQWGEWAPIASPLNNPADSVKGERACVQIHDGKHCSTVLASGEPEGAHWMERAGKKAAGDLLDGAQWHQFPEVVR